MAQRKRQKSDDFAANRARCEYLRGTLPGQKPHRAFYAMLAGTVSTQFRHLARLPDRRDCNRKKTRFKTAATDSERQCAFIFAQNNTPRTLLVCFVKGALRVQVDHTRIGIFDGHYTSECSSDSSGGRRRAALCARLCPSLAKSRSAVTPAGILQRLFVFLLSYLVLAIYIIR